MKRLIGLVGLVVLVTAGVAAPALACSGRMPLALPNTIVPMQMTVQRGRPCGPVINPSASTLTVEGLAVTELPRLGKVEVMRPLGFRYIAHRVGRDRFQVAYTGRTSLGAAYSIRYTVSVRVTD